MVFAIFALMRSVIAVLYISFVCLFVYLSLAYADGRRDEAYDKTTRLIDSFFCDKDGIVVREDWGNRGDPFFYPEYIDSLFRFERADDLDNLRLIDTNGCWTLRSFLRKGNLISEIVEYPVYMGDVVGIPEGQELPDSRFLEDAMMKITQMDRMSGKMIDGKRDARVLCDVASNRFYKLARHPDMKTEPDKRRVFNPYRCVFVCTRPVATYSLEYQKWAHLLSFMLIFVSAFLLLTAVAILLFNRTK